MKYRTYYTWRSARRSTHCTHMLPMPYNMHHACHAQEQQNKQTEGFNNGIVAAAAGWFGRTRNRCRFLRSSKIKLASDTKREAIQYKPMCSTFSFFFFFLSFLSFSVSHSLFLFRSFWSFRLVFRLTLVSPSSLLLSLPCFPWWRILSFCYFDSALHPPALLASLKYAYFPCVLSFFFLELLMLTYLNFFLLFLPFFDFDLDIVFIPSFSCGYYGVSSASVSAAIRLAYDIYVS